MVLERSWVAAERRSQQSVVLNQIVFYSKGRGEREEPESYPDMGLWHYGEYIQDHLLNRSVPSQAISIRPAPQIQHDNAPGNI